MTAHTYDPIPPDHGGTRPIDHESDESYVDVFRSHHAPATAHGAAFRGRRLGAVSAEADR